MKSLLQFIVKYHIAVVFAFLEIICFVLIVRYNEFHRSSVFNSGNVVAGTINEKWQGVVGYLNLKTENDALRAENAELINELEQRRALENDFSYFTEYSPFKYIPAQVINVSTVKVKNYFTINVGENDGVFADMAVVGDNGVAGIVLRTSPNYSVVIPIINTDFYLSVKIGRTEYFGSLQWSGRDYNLAMVNDISSYVNVAKGDTIFTSGFSSVFPANVPVGVVRDFVIDNATAFYNIQVKLCTDYKKLRHVYVVTNKDKNEINTLEEQTD
jgi:rod shape-determining protein MreC